MQSNINEGRFWVVHFSIFFLCLVGGAVFQWVDGVWQTSPWIGTLADITGASFGCAFAAASIVEVSMVIYNRFFKPVWEEQRREEGRKEGRQEGRKEGRQEGLREAREEMRAWWERRTAAEARGESFDEPPPFLSNGKEAGVGGEE